MKLIYSLAGIGLIFFAACSTTMNTFSDKDQTIDFTKYKTFAWLPNPDDSFTNELFNNQIIETNVKNYVNKEMQDRGFILDVDSPDLILDYNVDIERKPRAAAPPVYAYQYNYNWAYSPYYDNYYQYRYVNGAASPYTSYGGERIPYAEGTLTVSAIDRKRNRLIWRGWNLSAINDPVSYRNNLEKDIHSIFTKFPVLLPETVK